MELEKFKVGSFVIDNDEKCAPREVVMSFCDYLKKDIKGLLGTTDGCVIFLTDYNKHLFKELEDYNDNKSRSI